ncbi:hypothetical protein D3C80_1156030 [compost metagenome]
MATEGRGRRNAQPALGLTVGRGDGQLGLGQITLYLPDPLVIERTRRRQRHAARGTAEQAHLQMLFKPCQVLAHCRRAEPQGARTRSDATGFDYLDEAANSIEQVHVAPFGFVRISL